MGGKPARPPRPGGGKEGALNKAELVDKIAQKTGLPLRDVRTVIDAVFDPDPSVGLIADSLRAGEKVAISGFGTFEARARRARTGRNPHTGEGLNIPATRAPAFKAGKPLKETLKG
jgi:DNA-binding protein HU-beta